MHISDGVVSTPVWIGSYIIAAFLAGIITKNLEPEDIPKTAVVTSCFFVASLIHIPLGPTSVHLILNGLVGIILGPIAFISILLGLTLQALLFQHGGITTIGVNSIMMGLPAILAYKIFRLYKKFHFKLDVTLFGGLGGAAGVLGGVILLALFLISSGEEFLGIAKFAILAHLPVMIIEGIIAGFVVSFLMKVKPEILRGGKNGKD